MGEVLCRRHEKKKEPSRRDKAETASLHLSTKRLIIKLQNVDREQMRKVKQIDNRSSKGLSFFRRKNCSYLELFLSWHRYKCEWLENRHIIKCICSTSSLIEISFVPAGKQCGGMRWREEEGKKEERGVTREETKERRRTPRIGDIPR